MKILTSYFYQIRNFKPYMIPVSTACSDPKWYREFHIDKNGVINGFRLDDISPGPLCSGLCCGPDTCSGEPSFCEFLKAYKLQLELCSFDEIYMKLENIAQQAKEILNLKEDPEIILMFYEDPNNPCSERLVAQQYFCSHGIDCHELDLNLQKK